MDTATDQLWTERWVLSAIPTPDGKYVTRVYRFCCRQLFTGVTWHLILLGNHCSLSAILLGSRIAGGEKGEGWTHQPGASTCPAYVLHCCSRKTAEQPPLCHLHDPSPLRRSCCDTPSLSQVVASQPPGPFRWRWLSPLWAL